MSGANKKQPLEVEKYGLGEVENMIPVHVDKRYHAALELLKELEKFRPIAHSRGLFVESILHSADEHEGIGLDRMDAQTLFLIFDIINQL
jgi:hypothetical protein